MVKDEILKAIMELPKLEANKPICVMDSISVDDLMSAIDRFDKVPTYDELLKENKRQKEINQKAIEYIKENKEKYYQDWGQDDGSVDIYLDENEVKELLQILEDKDKEEEK